MSETSNWKLGCAEVMCSWHHAMAFCEISKPA
ncbi:Uncharacterised protein [Mycobacterium tuberculosis]|uniref:Uncharacterized protein n=1 Tax=Mycobacterium tuberculosis TaxID=1773 RepID=A0A655CEL8_MYCTX|nr:Uncharacterised protein [Mycobacterium tuberculosis]CNU08854.1 Uncharacterised protein [Mycobacterium tuberculosis]CPA41854.1 Uncharacterised protein [Mycobacterium tuberculosis]SGE33021.1 Uncharacterised protein [Mycobacterium tuberculosis]